MFGFFQFKAHNFGGSVRDPQFTVSFVDALLLKKRFVFLAIDLKDFICEKAFILKVLTLDRK